VNCWAEQGITGNDSSAYLLPGIVNTHGSMAQRVSGIFKKTPYSRPIYYTGMTAIASKCTKEGFAVGADSLRMDMHGRVVTESATKIFETGHPDFVGAYGICGNTALEFADGRPTFDVLESAKGIATDLTSLRFDSAQEYVEYFCNRLAARIAEASSGIVLPGNFGRVMFVGYTKAQAFCLQMEFLTVSGYMLQPRLLELLEAPIDRLCILSGSQVVWDEMGDIDFPETLAEAVYFVEDYITRCISNRTDPHCADIGGHAQIATVTDQGFSWVLRP
jgi:hypothetical protein